MIEMLTTAFLLAYIVLAVWLLFIPWFIYREIQRQGKDRAAEALKVIALLRILNGVEADRTAPPAVDPLQSALDSRFGKAG